MRESYATRNYSGLSLKIAPVYVYMVYQRVRIFSDEIEIAMEYFGDEKYRIPH